MSEENVVDVSVANFEIVFECASALRTLSDVLSNMLETVQIDVWKSPEFSGIKITAMDPKQISLIVSQLAADVRMDCEHTAFCVNTRTFQTCVRSAPAHFSINISSVESSSSIRIVAYELLSNTSVTRFTVPTLVCDQAPVRFKDIEYKTFIDMETSELKSIVGMCLKLQGDSLTFKVRQLRDDSDAAPKRPRCDKRHMVLTISSTGSCTQEHTFYSYVEERGDACVAGKCDAITKVPNDEDLCTVYEETFGARHLADFLRSIERHTVTLRMKGEKPLILHHEFGSEGSKVCLVVAPQIVEE